MSRHSVESAEWNEAETARLRVLWDEGLPTLEIGRRLGRTKSAIVGKAHRLELPGRRSPIVWTRRYGPPPPPGYKPARTCPVVTLPPMLPPVVTLPPVASPPVASPPPVVVFVLAEVAAPEVALAPPAEERRCQWPLTSGRPWRLCEAPVRGRAVYCTTHHAIACPRPRQDAAA